jgi:hypothetical protein
MWNLNIPDVLINMNNNSTASAYGTTTIAKQIEVYHTYRLVVDEAVVFASVTLLTKCWRRWVELDDDGVSGT